MGGTSAEIQGDSTSGVVYFQALAKEMETKVKDLEAKIKSGDLSAAQAAYVASRPTYEQIEVLAGAFEETDCSIDCRPDAFAKGENSPDFKGYHKIEHALYRNKSTKDAEAAAKGLVELNAKLQTELADPKNFDGVKSFEGMIGLAGEIVKKKIARGEEPQAQGVGQEGGGCHQGREEVHRQVPEGWYDDHVRRLLGHACQRPGRRPRVRREAGVRRHAGSGGPCQGRGRLRRLQPVPPQQRLHVPPRG